MEDGHEPRPQLLKDNSLSPLHIWQENGFGVDKDDPTQYHTQSGVVLRLKAVSSVLIRTRARALPIPRPPMYVNPQTEREEENWASPDYITALTEYDEAMAQLNMGTLYLLGTEVLTIPPGVPAPEDTTWSDQLSDPEIWGKQAMSIPQGGGKRYIMWLMYIALRDEELAEVGTQIRILGGAVPEEAVREAMDSFRHGDRRNGDNGVGPTNRAQRRKRK